MPRRAFGVLRRSLFLRGFPCTSNLTSRVSFLVGSKSLFSYPATPLFIQRFQSSKSLLRAVRSSSSYKFLLAPPLRFSALWHSFQVVEPTRYWASSYQKLAIEFGGDCVAGVDPCGCSQRLLGPAHPAAPSSLPAASSRIHLTSCRQAEVNLNSFVQGYILATRRKHYQQSYMQAMA
jgi:hypothetical protein